MKLPAIGHVASYAITVVSNKLEILMDRCELCEVEYMDSEGKER